MRELDFAGDLATLVAAGVDPATLARGDEHDGGAVTFAAPLLPGKIVAIGLNYRPARSGVRRCGARGAR